MIHADVTEMFNLEVTVNGVLIRRRVSTHLRLLDFLRDDLGLTGTKEVCGEGECGACTIVLDGVTVNSCLIFAVETQGSSIVTIEGLARKEEYAELLDAFVERHAVQCGYCIPGMVVSGAQILDEHKADLTRDKIKTELAGNICRCTGYQKIVDAVEQAGERRK